MNTKYLNGDELKPEGRIVRIASFKDELIYSQSERKKEPHTVLHFEGESKPLILTTANAKVMANVFGSPYMEDWLGKDIHLYPKMERHFGSDFQVARFKRAQPKAKEKLQAKGEKFDKAKQAVADGQTTIEKIQKHYDITPGALKALQEIEPKK